jgi:hypothetical protein
VCTLRNRCFIFTVGNVNGGLPPFEIPAFNIGNKTFPEIVKDMGSAVIAVPMISIMETIAIGKAFGKFFEFFSLIRGVHETSCAVVLSDSI